MLTSPALELARLLNQDRIDEARKALRGFCCADDRREFEKRADRSNRPATDPAACSC